MQKMDAFNGEKNRVEILKWNDKEKSFIEKKKKKEIFVVVEL